jgi:hypothetical protein
VKLTGVFSLGDVPKGSKHVEYVRGAWNTNEARKRYKEQFGIEHDDPLIIAEIEERLCAVLNREAQRRFRAMFGSRGVAGFKRFLLGSEVVDGLRRFRAALNSKASHRNVALPQHLVLAILLRQRVKGGGRKGRDPDPPYLQMKKRRQLQEARRRIGAGEKLSDVANDISRRGLLSEEAIRDQVYRKKKTRRG